MYTLFNHDQVHMVASLAKCSHCLFVSDLDQRGLVHLDDTISNGYTTVGLGDTTRSKLYPCTDIEENMGVKKVDEIRLPIVDLWGQRNRNLVWWKHILSVVKPGSHTNGEKWYVCSLCTGITLVDVD